MNGLIKEVAHSVPDQAVLGTIALVAFFAIYLVIVLRTLWAKKQDMQQAAEMIFDDDKPLAAPRNPAAAVAAKQEV